MDISKNEIDETIKNILEIFTGSEVIEDTDAPLSLSAEERRDAYRDGMRHM